MTYEENLARYRKNYRRDNNLDMIPATVYGYDTVIPGNVLVQFAKSNGRLSAPVSVRPPAKFMSLEPGDSIYLELFKGALRVAETDNETSLARGINPLTAILQPQGPTKIPQTSLATLAVTADGSLELAISAWAPIVNGTLYLFPGTRAGFVGTIPGHGTMCYAVLAVKSDYASLDVPVSTPRAETDLPLDVTDIQECLDSLTAGSTASLAIKLTGTLTGFTPEYLSANSLDLRQLVNSV